MFRGRRVRMSDRNGATSTGNSRRATKRIAALVANTHAATAVVVKAAAVNVAARNRRVAGKAAAGVIDAVTRPSQGRHDHRPDVY
jgi:hypothetical protein